MGFFSKLKQNFNHGGVKIDLQAPGTVSETDAGFAVAVTITNSGETAQSVKSIKVTLIEDRMQSMTPGQTTQTVGANSEQQLSAVSDENPFTLQPGESKQLNLTVPLNMGKLVTDALPDNAAAQLAGKLLGGAQMLMDAADKSNFRHYVDVVADVDGISFDPSARHEIHLLKPGQIGGSLNVHL